MTTRLSTGGSVRFLAGGVVKVRTGWGRLVYLTAAEADTLASAIIAHRGATLTKPETNRNQERIEHADR